MAKYLEEINEAYRQAVFKKVCGSMITVHNRLALEAYNEAFYENPTPDRLRAFIIEAVENYEICIDHWDERPSTFYHLARCYNALGRSGQAIKYYGEAFKRGYKFDEAHSSQESSWVIELRKEYHAAAPLKLSDFTPRQLEEVACHYYDLGDLSALHAVYYELGNSLYNKRDYKQAAEQYNMSSQFLPQDKNKVILDVYTQLALTYKALGKECYDKSEELHKLSLKPLPQGKEKIILDIIAQFNLAYKHLSKIWTDYGKKDEELAINVQKKAKEHLPTLKETIKEAEPLLAQKLDLLHIREPEAPLDIISSFVLGDSDDVSDAS